MSERDWVYYVNNDDEHACCDSCAQDLEDATWEDWYLDMMEEIDMTDEKKDKTEWFDGKLPEGHPDAKPDEESDIPEELRPMMELRISGDESAMMSISVAVMELMMIDFADLEDGAIEHIATLLDIIEKTGADDYRTEDIEKARKFLERIK